MDILKSLANSFIFWAAWIVIPLIMEVLPAIGSFIILIRREIASKRVKPPIIYPEISIIVPVYNSQDTLEECIRSIYEGDYPNDKIRVFLVNNKGTDDSFSVYTECQKKYPGLHMQWLNAEQGKSRALNLAIYNSDGKYIVHIDSDGILEPSALTRMIDKFEDNPKINCMTGAIMTRPDMIEEYPHGLARFFRKLEFMEYAQAFLAGRNYASDLNAIYTISGAFSAFRKSAILKSQLYNTDTLAEDTQITFQLRYLQKDRVYISEKSIFFVDPIENADKLYTQRQRWQRGSLEVSKMFIGEDMKARQLFRDINVKTLMYDHTFAFPRMIWYLALICLIFVGYSGKTILLSTLILFGIYTVCGYIYYLSTRGFLKDFKELRKYYTRQWWVVPFMPLFNLVVFFIRVAGIINSINTTSAWKTKTLSEEAESFSSTAKDDFKKNSGWFFKLRSAFNADPEKMYGEKPLDKRLKGSFLAYAAVVLTAMVSVVLATACFWSKKAFNVGVNEIIRTLFGGIKGAGGGTVGAALKFCLPIVAVFAVIIIALVILERRASRKTALAAQDESKIKKSKRIFAFRKTAAVLSVCMLIGAVIYTDYSYDIKSYIASKFINSSIYEQYYVDPKAVDISARGKTKNLIYIYLESMESTYASEDEGGFQKINYIPHMNQLAKDNVSFSTNSGFGGHYSNYGSTWTMGALFATTSALPYDLPPFESITNVDLSKYMFSGVTTLGDILEDNGYTNEFICGSNGHYAGRSDYFRCHGNYRIFDLGSMKEKGYVPPDYFVWWGVEDEYVYKAAKDELTALYNAGEPFNLTLLTADTHFTDGYICGLCKNDYPEKAANVVKCADSQLYEFVEWCRSQPFFEDTVIVITGDHPRMDTALVKGIDWQDRTVYNCYINASAEAGTYSLVRSATSLDVMPTVLSAMGFEIEGNRLGMGTNLFSNEQTLAAQLGFDSLDYQLSLNSDYYMKTFAPEFLTEEKAYPAGEIN